ncbi:MAG: helix-turn-helix transcriptional regulator [Actinomycetota bacterium]|nr:helix-turn-helix transcriptional regulator [Actinomycetota bacterium]
MPTEPALPRNFLRPCVLLLLRESPAHGYDLVERLRAFGFSGEDPGRLYRTLRTLEGEGLVRSAWEPSAHGPDRRIYAVTGSGMEALHQVVPALRETARVLDGFVSRYAEFVDIESPSSVSSSR